MDRIMELIEGLPMWLVLTVVLVVFGGGAVALWFFAARWMFWAYVLAFGGGGVVAVGRAIASNFGI